MSDVDLWMYSDWADEAVITMTASSWPLQDLVAFLQRAERTCPEAQRQDIRFFLEGGERPSFRISRPYTVQEQTAAKRGREEARARAEEQQREEKRQLFLRLKAEFEPECVS